MRHSAGVRQTVRGTRLAGIGSPESTLDLSSLGWRLLRQSPSALADSNAWSHLAARRQLANKQHLFESLTSCVEVCVEIRIDGRRSKRLAISV